MADAVERKPSALEIELRALFKGDTVHYPDDENHYCKTVVDSKGRTWLASFEGTTRTILARNVPMYDADGDEQMFTDIRVEEDGPRHTTILIDYLKDVDNYSALYLAVAKQDDYDLNDYMEVVNKLTGIVVKLPEDPEEYVSRIEYLVAMKDLMSKVEGDSGLLCYNADTKMLTTLNRFSLEHHPFRGPYLYAGVEATMLFSDTLVDCTSSEIIWEPRFKVKDALLLPATPEQIAACAKIGQDLVDRFISAKGYVHQQYEGNTYTQNPYDGSKVAKFTKSRVVVDAKGCQQFDTSRFRSLTEMEGVQIKTNDDDDITALTEFTAEKLAQLRPFIIVFNLTSGQWASGNVSHAVPVKHRRDAFEKVVLASERKRLVRALTSYHNESGGNIDIIDGKGGGMLFLMDGAPGTGKTLTAEATAEELERVLYKVSLGELGSSVEKLESALTKILALAERWKAVLLIDEADVFLEKRTSENLARNAVVAVFLRLLEYFSGLLFMTTNRGDNLDEAFLSRVTLGLHFQKPSAAGQLAIWNGLLSNAGIKLSAAEVATLVDFGVNGREIKNAINTARALAAFDNRELTASNISEVLEARKVFAHEVQESNRD